MAIVQLRNHTIGRAYVDRSVGEGKTSMEAVRALKRHLSDAIYHHMILDAQRARTSPGGQPGNDSDSSATTHIPPPALRISHFPDPSPPGLEPELSPRLDTEGRHERMDCLRHHEGRLPRPGRERVRA